MVWQILAFCAMEPHRATYTGGLMRRDVSCTRCDDVVVDVRRHMHLRGATAHSALSSCMSLDAIVGRTHFFVEFCVGKGGVAVLGAGALTPNQSSNQQCHRARPQRIGRIGQPASAGKCASIAHIQIRAVGIPESCRFNIARADRNAAA